MHHLRRIERLATCAANALTYRTSKMTYARTLEAIAKLADALHSTETDESVWYLNEYTLTPDAIIVGAYWFCADYHGGQRSVEYRTLSTLSRIFTPGSGETGPRPESSAQDTYDALVELSGL
jgi:hypothetical protein